MTKKESTPESSQGVKPKVIDADQDWITANLWYMTLGEARELYDWTGCTPLVNQNGLLIGVVVNDQYREPDYDIVKYNANIQAFQLRE